MRTSLVYALFLLAAACEEPAPPVASQPEAPTPPVVEEVEPAPEPASVKSVAESEARKTVEAWLAAQNGSDFDAYEKLYASRFEGVKRVGPKKFSYGREGWLKDRGRMFQKAMRVSIDDVRITAGADSATVRFEQTWASGDYQDVGPKVLVLTEEGDRLVIAREEMLASKPLDAAGSEQPKYDPMRAGIVLGDLLVLSTDTTGVRTESPTLLARGGEAIATVTDAPKRLKDLVGKSVKLGGGERPCTARIDRLAVLAHAVPHFGEVRRWDGEMDAPRLDDAQVARQIWQLAEGSGHVVVGRLDKACDGALWARAADADSLALRTAAAEGDVRNRVLQKFRGLASHKEIQKQFEQSGGKGPWDVTGGAEPTVRMFEGEGRRFVSVAAAAGSGCGSFLGEAWAIFELRGDSVVLLTDTKAGGHRLPSTALLVAGEPVFVTDHALIERVGAVWRVTTDVSPPYFDCPC